MSVGVPDIITRFHGLEGEEKRADGFLAGKEEFLDAVREIFKNNPQKMLTEVLIKFLSGSETRVTKDQIQELAQMNTRFDALLPRVEEFQSGSPSYIVDGHVDRDLSDGMVRPDLQVNKSEIFAQLSDVLSQILSEFDPETAQMHEKHLNQLVTAIWEGRGELYTSGVEPIVPEDRVPDVSVMNNPEELQYEFSRVASLALQSTLQLLGYESRIEKYFVSGSPDGKTTQVCANILAVVEPGESKPTEYGVVFFEDNPITVRGEEISELRDGSGWKDKKRGKDYRLMPLSATEYAVL